MISDAIAAARQDLLLRDLLERAELREMCLQVLTALSGQDLGRSGPVPAQRVVPNDEPGAER
jgi:hypothetical protein